MPQSSCGRTKCIASDCCTGPRLPFTRVRRIYNSGLNVLCTTYRSARATTTGPLHTVHTLLQHLCCTSRIRTRPIPGPGQLSLISGASNVSLINEPGRKHSPHIPPPADASGRYLLRGFALSVTGDMRLAALTPIASISCSEIHVSLAACPDYAKPAVGICPSRSPSRC